MYNFGYHRPTTVADAVALLGSAEDPKIMAGGQTLIPTMKQRLASPSDVIDLGAIAELKGIKLEGEVVVIGAMTTHGEVAASSVVKSAIPGLHALASVIGDAQVRNRGTLGGSISNNDPAADYPGAVVALGATIVTNKRRIDGAAFFTGMFETALEDGEIVTEVRFPKAIKSSYEKFRNPASRYAIVGVFIAQTAQGIRVAVTGAGPCVFRETGIEQALTANLSASAIDAVTVSSGDLNSDMHASAEYRANLIKVMAKRAVASLA